MQELALLVDLSVAGRIGATTELMVRVDLAQGAREPAADRMFARAGFPVLVSGSH